MMLRILPQDTRTGDTAPRSVPMVERTSTCENVPGYLTAVVQGQRAAWQLIVPEAFVSVQVKRLILLCRSIHPLLQYSGEHHDFGEIIAITVAHEGSEIRSRRGSEQLAGDFSSLFQNGRSGTRESGLREMCLTDHVHNLPYGLEYMYGLRLACTARAARNSSLCLCKLISLFSLSWADGQR